MLIGLLADWVKRITFLPTYWPAILLLIMYTVKFNPNVFVNRLVITPFVVGIMLIVYSLLGHYENVPDPYVYPFGPMTDVYPFIMAAIVLLNIERSDNRQRVIRNISKFTIWIILIGFMLSFTTEVLFPGTSRVRRLDEVPVFFWTMSFGMLYALPFLGLILINFLKGYKKHIVSLLLIFFCAHSGFLTLTIFMLFGVSIAYFEKLKKWTRTAITVFGLILVGLVSSVNLGEVAVSVLSLLPNDVYLEKAEKLTEINDSSNGDVEDLRGDVYSTSLESFYKYPVFGVGDYSTDKIGYHSFWLDKLGFLGIFGTIPYLFILITFYFYLKKRYFKEDKIWLRSNYLLFFLLFLNPFQFWNFWMIVYVVAPVLKTGIEEMINVKQIKKLELANI